MLERDKTKRRIAARNKQVDAAVINNAEDALGAVRLNRMVQRRSEIFENDRNAVNDCRGQRCGMTAAKGGLDDQENEARYTQQASNAVGHGVHNLLAQGVVRNCRGFVPRLRTVAGICHKACVPPVVNS